MVYKAEFWGMVGEADGQSNRDTNSKCLAITTAIAKLPEQRALEFLERFEDMTDRAYTWRL